jgi:hypothetical protein
MYSVNKLCILFLFLVSGHYALGQEEAFKHHKIMVVLGHAMTPEGVNVEGKKTLLFLPSWGLDYDYRFNEKWSAGLHTDLIIENFLFEDQNNVIRERSAPISLVLSGGRKFGDHLTLLVGGGIELAKEENLEVIRIGADYGWEIEDWEVALNYMIDFKIDAYNTGILGVGIARAF